MATSKTNQSSEAANAFRPENLSENAELALREEIRATQAAQADLLKWKLIAVAGVVYRL